MEGRRQRASRTVALLGLAALLASGVAACGSEEPPEASVTAVADASALPDAPTVVSFTWEPVVAEDLPPAEREDLEMFAESEGLPVDEALANFGNQQVIGELINRVASAFPLDYATGELDGENGGRIWFTGAPPPEALRLIEEAAATVSVQAGPERLFTEDELARATEIVNGVALELLPDGVSGAGAEPMEGVVVGVYDLGGMTVEELTARITADPRVQRLDIPVVIDFDRRHRFFGGDDG